LHPKKTGPKGPISKKMHIYALLNYIQYAQYYSS
jgi:hypothetical protein